MGKKSVKENKNIYFTSREEAGLTREQASELMSYVSADRIEKIEYEKSLPHPDEILAMAECYKNPLLCNHYCANVCPIGQVYVPAVELKDLPRIILEMLSFLNAIEKEKNRLIEITADGEISQDEYSDFAKIKEKLDQISLTVDSLQLWIDNEMAKNKIEKDVF